MKSRAVILGLLLAVAGIVLPTLAVLGVREVRELGRA